MIKQAYRSCAFYTETCRGSHAGSNDSWGRVQVDQNCVVGKTGFVLPNWVAQSLWRVCTASEWTISVHLRCRICLVPHSCGRSAEARCMHSRSSSSSSRKATPTVESRTVDLLFDVKAPQKNVLVLVEEAYVVYDLEPLKPLLDSWCRIGDLSLLLLVESAARPAPWQGEMVVGMKSIATGLPPLR